MESLGLMWNMSWNCFKLRLHSAGVGLTCSALQARAFCNTLQCRQGHLHIHNASKIMCKGVMLQPLCERASCESRVIGPENGTEADFPLKVTLSLNRRGGLPCY
eukprot:6157700-Amphidinium_carterae.1